MSVKVAYIKDLKEIQEIAFDVQILILNRFSEDDKPENLPICLEKILILKTDFETQKDALEHFKSEFKIPFGCSVGFLRPEIENPKFKLTLHLTPKPDEEYETKTHFMRVWDLKNDIGTQEIEVLGSRKDRINVDEVKLILTHKKPDFRKINCMMGGLKF